MAFEKSTRRAPGLQVRLANCNEDLLAAQRLRYEVFVEELGGGGPLVDHDARLERDHFDPFFDHLLLIEQASGDVVGVYRLMRHEDANRAGGFYSEAEYDLTPLIQSKRKMLELGRSCLRADMRGGVAMHQLWVGLADYVARHEIEILFGVASFHGTDLGALSQPMSLLHHHHLAPPDMRVRARDYQNMNLIAQDQLDVKAARAQLPSLIKAYLRMGGCVGEGAFVDHTFNTVDVCLILDTARMNDRQARFYRGTA